MSSSKRSSNIPISFDRFHIKSTEFLSPFRNHQYKTCIEQKSERSWMRKIRVHPSHVNSSKSERIDKDAAHLFHTNKQSNINTSLESKTLQNKKYSNKLFHTQSTSNIIGVVDKLPVTNVSCSSQFDVPGRIYPPTPCMIRYRHSSLPTLIPTYFDHKNQFNAFNKQ